MWDLTDDPRRSRRQPHRGRCTGSRVRRCSSESHPSPCVRWYAWQVLAAMLNKAPQPPPTAHARVVSRHHRPSRLRATRFHALPSSGRARRTLRRFGEVSLLKDQASQFWAAGTFFQLARHHEASWRDGNPSRARCL
eukprot:3892880-Prymnesium_polylepis.2